MKLASSLVAFGDLIRRCHQNPYLKLSVIPPFNFHHFHFQTFYFPFFYFPVSAKLSTVTIVALFGRKQKRNTYMEMSRWAWLKKLDVARRAQTNPHRVKVLKWPLPRKTVWSPPAAFQTTVQDAPKRPSVTFSLSHRRITAAASLTPECT
jgi:hypothetical protein